MFYYQKAVGYESSKLWVRIILGLGTNRKHTLLVRLRRLRLPRRPQPGNRKHILEGANGGTQFSVNYYFFGQISVNYYFFWPILSKLQNLVNH